MIHSLLTFVDRTHTDRHVGKTPTYIKIIKNVKKMPFETEMQLLVIRSTFKQCQGPPTAVSSMKQCSALNVQEMNQATSTSTHQYYLL